MRQREHQELADTIALEIQNAHRVMAEAKQRYRTMKINPDDIRGKIFPSRWNKIFRRTGKHHYI